MNTKKRTKKDNASAENKIKNKRKPCKKICLALQGGGAYGAFTWGVLDKLLEDERLIIDAISATSAGSVNAVILAYGLCKGGRQGARDALRDFWEAISCYGIAFNPMRDFLQKNLPYMQSLDHLYFLTIETITRLYSPYLLNPFNFNLLRTILSKKIDFQLLKNQDIIKLFICATHIESGKLKIFDNTGLSIDAILASACLPHLHQAVEIEGNHYWDGGFLGNPAIFPLIYNSTTSDIIIVHTNPISRAGVPTNSTEIANRVNEISFNSSLMRELRAISFVSKLRNEGWIKEEYLEKIQRKFIHMVRADKVMEKFGIVNKFNWHGNDIQELYKIGQNVAAQWLESHFDDIEKKSSIDFNEFL